MQRHPLPSGAGLALVRLEQLLRELRQRPDFPGSQSDCRGHVCRGTS
jgi:hypothetical protein